MVTLRHQDCPLLGPSEGQQQDAWVSGVQVAVGRQLLSLSVSVNEQRWGLLAAHSPNAPGPGSQFPPSFRVSRSLS